jgi:hypothetical protein
VLLAVGVDDRHIAQTTWRHPIVAASTDDGALERSCETFSRKPGDHVLAAEPQGREAPAAYQHDYGHLGFVALDGRDHTLILGAAGDHK